MAKRKPAAQPYTKPDQIQIRGNQIFSPLRQKWISLTPEEMVRQHYLQVLVEEYGFNHEHMAEELCVTGRGSAQARADFVIWRTPHDKATEKSPLIVVECKADNVTIEEMETDAGHVFDPLYDLAVRLCDQHEKFVHSYAFLPIATEVYARHSKVDAAKGANIEAERLRRAERWLRDFARWFDRVGGADMPVPADPAFFGPSSSAISTNNQVRSSLQCRLLTSRL